MLLPGLRNIFNRVRRSGRASAELGAAPAHLAAGVLAGLQAGDANLSPNLSSNSPAPAKDAPEWSDARLELAESLWGEGFLTPGGATEIQRLSAPLGLSAAASLLLVGASAGGAARSIATDYGAWVTGYYHCPELLDFATHRLHRAPGPAAKRISSELWTPATRAFGPRPHGFHHALTIDALRGGEAGQVLKALSGAIRPGGQLVMLEFVADQPLDPTDPATAAWCRLERRNAATMPRADQVSRLLGMLKFEIRVVEDNSHRHMVQAVQGWERLLRTLEGHRPPPAAAAALVAEAELWTRRLRMLHANRIRLLRWHAIAATTH